jgi:hypothetical protein
MRARQRGITFVGWLILLVPLAIVFYAGVRLTPVYLNYMKVAHSLDALKSEYKGDSTNAQSLGDSLLKQFEIQSVDYPTVKDISIKREGRGWVVEASYDDQAPLFSNISLQVAFDKVVELGGGD